MKSIFIALFLAAVFVIGFALAVGLLNWIR